MRFDFIIKNGHVIDPSLGIDDIKDIGVVDRKVYKASGDDLSVYPAIDAYGHLVLPGLIDFHTHIFDTGSGLGIHPDFFLATGVTTAVDGGSAGCANYEAFHVTKVQGCKCRIKAQINISSQGQFQLGFPENYNPKFFKEKKISELVKKHSEEIIGIKMRLSKETVGEKGLESFLEMLKIAENLKMPVVVHTTDPAISVEEIAEHLRPNDVYCHCYQGEGMTIIDENDRVNQYIRNARNRGVIFDSCNGTLNFNFKVAKAAIADNFFPDIISSDTSFHSFSLPFYCKNLPFVMSKYISMGMNLNEVVRAVTNTPAKLIGMEGEVGTLRDGAFADISILEKKKRKVIFSDKKEEFEGEEILVNKFTMLDGEVVFCSNDFWG